MNLKHIIISATALTVGLFCINAAFKGEPKDGLDKRIFIVNMTEIKDGAASKKATQDEIEFKAGKGMFSQFLFDKLEYKWIKYEVTKDSTYTDEDNNENHWTEAEISTTDETDQTMIMKCVVDNYDISGDIKITKKDKLKKRFEFSGKEKPKKK